MTKRLQERLLDNVVERIPSDTGGLAHHSLRLDVGRTIAVDAEGNVYVTGETGGGPISLNAVTIGYDPTGGRRWVQTYEGPGNNKDAGCFIALDDAGDVYVSGVSTGGDASRDYFIIKSAADGRVLWITRYNGPSDDNDDLPQAMTLDRSGNVLITGHSSGTLAATVKYGPDGEELWVERYAAPGDRALASDIAVDAVGNAIVTGTIVVGDTARYFTAKYSVTSPPFLRGDCNGDGVLDVADPVANLDFQFLGQFKPPCLDALDFDDSGEIDVTDPIANLTHQFLGAPPPAPPGKDCGVDPTEDELTCETVEGCP